MDKTKKKKSSLTIKNKSINEIEIGRTGGQIALGGFGYQLLFSCYIALDFLVNDSKIIKFEGIEDIDLYKSTLTDDQMIYHIQLKCSKDKQDASFFDDILKNYLEVYLADKKNDNRFFKLVYDAEIAKGNLSKLVEKKLDKSSIDHWNKKIEKLKIGYPIWNWKNFDFCIFYNQLQFEKFSKNSIESGIKKLLIARFGLDTGNENLFVNTLFYNVFHKAQGRNGMTYHELLKLMQDTKDDIAKGYQNPSYKWIDKINFEILQNEENFNEEYFEGKKATPSDIVHGLAIRRESLENIVKESIKENQITVIKSSSGQGKTTLAWQVAYSLKNEYTIYKLNWCKDSKEISNIVEYFNSRLKLGERILIILDNLDVELKEWNKLSQNLAVKLQFNYSILVTTREDDWYAFSGDQSNLSSLKIVDLFMDSDQAEKIYDNLKTKSRIHESIINWQTSWEKVKDKRLLIEYVYLLTHGEMIQERISYQLKMISQETNASIKLELLRQISLSDTIGIQLPVVKLLSQFEDTSDLNSIIKSIKDEYFIKIDKDIDYVEGLHPVRSHHIVEILHEYYPISKTLTKLLNIVDEFYIGKMYSQIPVYLDENVDDFYSKLAATSKNKSYSYQALAIQGVFSGSVLKYYNSNKIHFDDADKHGGLELFLFEINPWNNNQYGIEVKTLEDMNRQSPENQNIKYLLELSNNINKFDIKKSHFYIYTYYVFLNLKEGVLKRDLSNFASLAKWLIRVDKKFDIVSRLNFDNIWETREDWNFDELSQLMYEFHELSQAAYLDFVSKNKDTIISYLRIKTDTLRIYEESDGIHIKYILLPQDIKKANAESVRRINAVCKFLPIYEIYFADSIKPRIDFVDVFSFHDESHKEMPLRNVIISFNIDLNQLWSKSILSYYEFSSVYDWQNYWIDMRKKVIEFAKCNIEVLEKLLKQQNQYQSTLNTLDEIKCYICNSLILKKSFPNEERPFEEKSVVNGFISKMKHDYFTHIINYLNMYINIIQKNKENSLCNLAIGNLRDSRNKLQGMQECFNSICSYTMSYFDVSDLEKQEMLWLDRLILLNEYYVDNIPSIGEFNRHSVFSWNQEKKEELIRLINEKIKEASKNSSVTFIYPNKILSKDNLLTVPIGVKNLNLNDENMLTLLVSLIPFSEVNVNYILFIMINSKLRATSYGIRINTNLFKKMKQCINNDESLNMDIMSRPLPCEITNEHLGCFQENIQLINNTQSTDFNDIDTFLIALWEYTQYLNCLMDLENEEKIYLTNKLKEKAMQIEKNFSYIKDKIPIRFMDRLITLKDELIKAKITFNDTDLNNWLNEIILYINNNQ